MKSKNVIIILISIVVVIAAFMLFNKGEHILYGCRKNNCGGFDLSCESGAPLNCPAIYMPGNVCGKFVTCGNDGLSCKTIKSDNYDKCISCFSSCTDIRLWDNCTLKCDEDYGGSK
ncbi:hypothetical protein A3K64_00500 [Candidatus Micrarchaeota archaeon RBG_16_36_9]|nr:MAG: hypothetical protein A3K64_00500 [Candidatus Micrarchaeota archaeon RBG_16_36_9]